MKWVDLGGMLLQFVAFWFAAPELIGASSLQRFEKGLIRFIAALPNVLFAGGAIIFGLSMAIYGSTKGMEASHAKEGEIMETMIIIIAVSAVLVFYMLVFAKRTQAWITDRFAKPMILKLIQQNEMRKSALVIAAILFTVGFLCQFVIGLLS